jgi:hypothetical protein
MGVPQEQPVGDEGPMGQMKQFETGGQNLPGGNVQQIPGSDAVQFNGQTHDQGGIMMDSKTEVENETVTKLEENIKNLQDATDKSNKQLDLGKTRKQWEEMIVAMEDRINSVSLQSVSSLADMIKDDPDNSKLVTIMDKLNTFTKYRDTLKENMKYLDGLK